MHISFNTEGKQRYQKFYTECQKVFWHIPYNMTT